VLASACVTTESELVSTHRPSAAHLHQRVTSTATKIVFLRYLFAPAQLVHRWSVDAPSARLPPDTNKRSPDRASSGCLPAPLLRPLPCTSLLFGVRVARNAGRAVLWGPPACTISGTAEGSTPHASTRWITMPGPSRAHPSYQENTANKSGTKSHTQSARRDTARQLQVGDTLPCCTFHQAAITAWTRAKRALFSQHRLMPRTCVRMQNSSISGTCQLREPKGRPKCGAGKVHPTRQQYKRRA